MGISVNGVDIDDSVIEREMAHHQSAANPLKQSVHEVVLRAVLLQEAARLGIEGENEDARIEALFAQEVRVPEADTAACEIFYRNQPERFTSGAMVEARHILFQVTAGAPLELLRETGQAVLSELRAHPERFAELAREYSNCSSGAVGGSLGQLTLGQTVPEFEKLLFRLAPGAMAEHLLETRFGLHIVQVLRRIDGVLLPFDAVQAQIADRLKRAAWQRALHQYLQILVGRADIEGITLEGADGALVQ
ncbi:peptidylprolyl isomerase [Janthinobacterium sp.]|uniref:peptidylprolyl isomerase n=1 Tax=Janthinobacterium sp. TaxID=1871054 RepID=UPI00293D41CD|nr:peptidylprolyl isomerase [Janthinobacterium sp.]